MPKSKDLKYALIESDTVVTSEDTLYRIIALRTIPNVVKQGELGGYIAAMGCLSHEGNCWVGNEAKVGPNVAVTDNALVLDNAQAYGNCHIEDNALVCDHAYLFGRDKDGLQLIVRDNAVVSGRARILDQTWVADNAWVHCRAVVRGTSTVHDHAEVYGDVTIEGDSLIRDHCVVSNSDPYVRGILKDIHIRGSVELRHWRDIITFTGFGSCGRRTVAYYDHNSDTVGIICGCFRGTLELFKKEVRLRHKNNPKWLKDYLAVIQTIKVHFELK